MVQKGANEVRKVITFRTKGIYTVRLGIRKSIFFVLSLIKHLRPEMKTLIAYYMPEVVSDL